ncbi:MAG: 3-ketoacyl-ACP reductase [Verrucomicrobiae bacterium]|nr:3-ketoacyl-ACP reductase [Verrucomicrobiae bacterium]
MHSAPVALVTGASRGIGRGIAVALARAGYGVAINYAGNAAAAEECRRLCAATSPEGASTRFAPLQADISQAADRRRLVEETLRLFGRLDLLVNNAGVAPAVRADLLDASEESLDRLLAVNVKGPFFLTQLVARHWQETAKTWPAHGNRPKIVTISSISASTASVNRGDYCISKAALTMLTPLFAARLAELGVRVYEIRPGIIATDMTGPVKAKYDALIAGGLTPIRRWGAPEDVGRAVVAFATDAFPFTTGEVIHVDGGFHLRTL